MTSSYFYPQPTKNNANHRLLDELENWSTTNRQQAYVVNKPLGDEKYTYAYDSALVILSPKRRLIFVDYGNRQSEFETFVGDFIEDLGSISDKYRYRLTIGRPRDWKDLVMRVTYDPTKWHLETILGDASIADPGRQRVAELLISLLTGSINNIDRVGGTEPATLLDRVKQKILLFDGDQTRFIYQKPSKQQIRIQGLSGTGKTELLLHKLKELYTGSDDSRIVFTCHNRILADSLRSRIPEFFDFMKVEQQIKWRERLWCMHAWGSQSDAHSGTYRYICHHYGIPFHPWSRSMSFDMACKLALQHVTANDSAPKPFDTVLIDESQDFPDSFFELCAAASTSTVYIAGDIFQSIFDEEIVARIDPDFLLSKCYRTDPKTLMFAHGLGMGLFEPIKLRWLEPAEWEACGYMVETLATGRTQRLRREPLRRFEDLEQEGVNSVEIVPSPQPFYANAAPTIVEILQTIARDHPTVRPDDIGIILLDSGSPPFALADQLQQIVPRSVGWDVNKAYETKQKIPNALFISNKNNVKGLEFPFVICVTRSIYRYNSYRNALYMTLTRSFIKTFLVLDGVSNQALLPELMTGLQAILQNGYMDVTAPSLEEQALIRTTISVSEDQQSFFDFVSSVFDELDVPEIFRTPLYDIVLKISGEVFDRDKISQIVDFNYRQMAGE
jgi:superfamily I DNA and RNA helicase